MATTGRQFRAEFEREAVQQTKRPRNAIAQVAKDLELGVGSRKGIAMGTISKWMLGCV